MTAITFVALGTSLPDMFASRAATVASSSADAAITNITGSNSVNVFLGLGLPWFIASVYWAAVGETDEWISRVSRGGVAGRKNTKKTKTAMCSCHIDCPPYFRPARPLNALLRFLFCFSQVPSCLRAEYSGAFFYVPAGELGFSVIIFSVCCVTALGSLMVQRVKHGAELGGPYAKPLAGFFCGLWFFYILMSSLKSYGHI